MTSTLSPDELHRYSRHLLLKEFGMEGQEKLKNAKVLVVGCGGLGSPVLLYLAAAGVGTLGLIDNDNIDESNLQRQILFDTSTVGKPKVLEAEKRLKALNPFVKFNTFETALSSQNVLSILKDYDLVIDGTDNFPTRYLINDACMLLNKPFVYGAIYKYEGQVAVFNYQNGPNYRDLFPNPPPPDLAPNCSEAGVLGVLPGIIGTLQANETIKLLTNIGQPLTGKLFILDSLTLKTTTIKIQKLGDSPKITKLIDYEEFCNLKPKQQNSTLTASELKFLIGSDADFQLIDIRESYEYQLKNIDGQSMPLSEIDNFVNQISRDKIVVVHCQSGMRSQKAIEYLKEKYGFENLKNLEGGLLAYLIL